MTKYLFFLITLNFSINTHFFDTNQKFKEAYFASGCFWCVESIYENLKGVVDVESGYSGGKTSNPTYYEVMTGKTGHAEAVKVIYDPEVINFETLIRVFFGSHDPTTLNRQGPDRGTQYRSIAFFKTNNEKDIIEKEIQRLISNNTYKKITTEVLAFKKFYKAEDYHQDYKKNNPNDIYILRISNPRISKFKMDFKEILK